MQNDSNRNTLVFIVAAMVLLFVYQYLVIQPANEKKAAELKAQAAAGEVLPQAPGAPAASSAPAPTLSRAEAKALSPRTAIDTPTLAGSVNLTGARIDDLYLKRYRETISKDSPPVDLLRPQGAPNAWFAEFSWLGDNLPGLPGPETVWTLKQGEVLAPGKPLVLTYSTPEGLAFTRAIAVDENYLFTITDTVANLGTAPVTLAPYAAVQRQGLPPHLGKAQSVHEGAIGMLGGELRQAKYKKWKKEGEETHVSTGGWLGVTDKYWFAALIPGQSEKFTGQFRSRTQQGVDLYDASLVGAARLIGPGRQITETTHLFAGAKVVPVLRAYEKQLAAPRFDWAVDWGLFSFFTRPIFMVLEQFYHWVGNFGVAILMLTVVIKLLFFPLANKSYESITKMKKVQPQMEALKERFKDDPAEYQKEMMGMYQREKINPLMGCLPMLATIPVFYALYKVLSVTLEMRHAPFFGWIQDLSSRDPTTFTTLFGLVPWDPAATPMIGGLLDQYLHIGVWPLLMGFTMWLQQAMNPPAPDPMQQRIFKLFPYIFTVMMAQFAAGLVIYWTWSNLLSILQQYVIMRRFKVDNPIDDLLARFRSGKAAG